MPDLIKGLILRSAVIGLLSGGVLGGLFGVNYLYLAFIWTGLVGAGLGISLGLINGLLVSAITCLFYPLHRGRRYRLTITVMSTSIAWAGVIVAGPWYFSDTSMTPISAVLIGFSSVLASAVAGWAGGLTGQHMAQWASRPATAQPALVAEQATSDTTFLNRLKRYFDDIFSDQQASWVMVALFALVYPRPGNSLLEFLVCGDFNANVVSCLPSPRLYTSVVAGLRVSLPILLFTVLAIALVQSQHRNRRGY